MNDPLARVEIDGIAAGGDGVARTEGMVVFTPRTAIGDVALVRLTRHKRFARGTLISLDRESPDRIVATCAHYVQDRCGGCQLQHMTYDAQRRAKATIIADSLRRIGRRETPQFDVEASEAQWRYRRKLTLHLRRSGDHWIAGLHPYDDPRGVFQLEDCPIPDERVLAVWTSLRARFEFLPSETALRVAVRLGSGGAAVVVEGGRSWPDPERFIQAVDGVVELWWKPEQGRTRRIAARIGGQHAGASFAQVNARVAMRLRDYVLDRVRAHSPTTVVDAYAGVGDTALALASETTVTAIELDASAVEQFADRLRLPSRAISGRVEERLEEALPADVVLLNPPRSGVDPHVTNVLEHVTSPPRAIIYVSCDAATLARDLARMPRYRLASVRAYDMFPQTAHVETVCELVPEAA